MEISPLQHAINATNIPPEDLAGNKALTPQQKVCEASRQFEAILLRQILSETQKTVIPSEFSDNSTASGVYQDMVTNALADDISKTGSFGLAKIFERQLSPPSAAHAKRPNGALHNITAVSSERHAVSVHNTQS